MHSCERTGGHAMQQERKMSEHDSELPSSSPKLSASGEATPAAPLRLPLRSPALPCMHRRRRCHLERGCEASRHRLVCFWQLFWRRDKGWEAGRMRCCMHAVRHIGPAGSIAQGRRAL